jgi:hypothetical protein
LLEKLSDRKSELPEDPTKRERLLYDVGLPYDLDTSTMDFVHARHLTSLLASEFIKRQVTLSNSKQYLDAVIEKGYDWRDHEDIHFITEEGIYPQISLYLDALARERDLTLRD